MLGGAAIAIDMTAVPVTLTREAAGSYVNGLLVPGAPTTIPIRATVLAVDAKALRDLPEGIRSEARLSLWSRSEVRLEDRITWAGATYRATFVWPRGEGAFFKAVLALVGPER